MREKYKMPRMQEIHLILGRCEVANGWRQKWQMGGDRRMAVTLQLVSELGCTQMKISSWDTNLSNFDHLFPVRDKMKALEGAKEKFSPFKGIVDPTNYQK